jgi:hypothetical protein
MAFDVGNSNLCTSRPFGSGECTDVLVRMADSGSAAGHERTDPSFCAYASREPNG